MKLSTDQSLALTNIRGLFNGSHREQILTGGPGTGKSFLTAQIIKEAEANNFNIILAATTNPAVSIIEGFTKYPATTFHKLMDLKVKENYATQETETFRAVSSKGPMICQLTNPKIKTLIIIDEVSYLDDLLYEYVLEALDEYPNMVFLYIGDADQLPPVGSEEPYIFTLDIPKNILSIDHRFASDSQIAEICTQLKYNIRDKSYFLTDIKTGKDITILDGDEFMEKMEELYCSPEYAENPFYVKSVAYKNKMVDKMNDYIRSFHFEGEDYQVGERLIVNKPLSRKQAILANNGEIVTVVSNEPIEMYDIKCQLLYLRKENTSAPFKAVVTKQYVKKNKVRKQLVAEATKTKKWKPLYDFMESFIELKPIYASTIHKAQGASYNNVMLHLENLVECRDHTILARLLFVAVSRASEHVYVYGEVPNNLLRSKK